MNKGYAAVRLFFLAKKIKPKAANPNIMAKPTPQVRPMPLVSQMGVRPTNTSFQDMMAE